MLYGANQSMEPPPAQRPNLDRKPLFNASEGRDYAQDAPLRLSVDRQMTSRSKKSEERMFPAPGIVSVMCLLLERNFVRDKK